MNNELFSLSTDALRTISTLLPEFVSKLKAVEANLTKLSDRVETSEKMVATLCSVVGHLATLVAGKVPDGEECLVSPKSQETLTHADLPAHPDRSHLTDHSPHSDLPAHREIITLEDDKSELSASSAGSHIYPKKRKRRFRKNKGGSVSSQQKCDSVSSQQKCDSGGSYEFDSWNTTNQWWSPGPFYGRVKQRGLPCKGQGWPPSHGRPDHNDLGHRNQQGGQWKKGRGFNRDLGMKIIYEVLSRLQSDCGAAVSPDNHRHYYN